MKLQEKINALGKTGKFFSQFASVSFAENKEVSDLNSRFAEMFSQIIETSNHFNPWFTPEFIRLSLLNWGNALNQENLLKWTEKYPELKEKPVRKSKIGLVMAGNIPLVGFHDLISVILSGHIAHAKLSSKDDKLLPAIKQILQFIHPEFTNLIFFEEEKLLNMDAYIATGSNNSARYFKYYFGKYPHIIRKNRNSAAVLTGNESDTQLKLLADDIFLYFGLGCRNVSKIFIPRSINMPDILPHFEYYNYFTDHNKYMNNYEYYRSYYMVNIMKIFDNGFLICKEDEKYSSKVGCLFYEHYDSLEELKNRLVNDAENIQCVVATEGIIGNSIEFGQTQQPGLWDYADNIDTLEFLINL